MAVELNATTANKWSETDASNTSSPPDGAPAGMFPSQSEGVWRGTMATVQRFWNRINGAITSTGSANAYVYTPSNTSYPTAYVQGEIYSFKANFANTGATTLNINSLGAKNIYKKGNSGVIALVGGEIQSGDMVSVSYDGTQFQLLSWIPIPATSNALTASSINGGQLAGLRNRIINGDMRIDQRNTGSSQTITAGAGAAYTVDRFYATCTGANVTGQRVSGSGADQYVYRFTGAASVTGIAFGQRIEAVNIYDLVSTTATLSVELSNSVLTTVTWTAYYPTAGDNWASRTQIATGTFTITSTPTVYNAQIALGANITAGLEIELTVGAQTSGTWSIGQFQLENGSTATPFERRPLGIELPLSQRYFYMASVFVPAGSSYGITCPRKVSMRITPVYSGGGSGFVAQNNNAETSGLSQTTGANQTLSLNSEL